MTHAKLTNGQLIYSTNFEFIDGNWVSYPTDEQLINNGFKEVVYRTVDVYTEQYNEIDNEIFINQQYVEQTEEVI